MSAQIIFLRAINVGGHNKVKMADLRSFLGSLGFIHVKTYIQSGNILCDTNPMSEGQLSAHLSEHFGFEIPCVFRTLEQVQQCIEQFPLPFNEPKNAYACFFQEPLNASLLSGLDEVGPKGERFGVQNNTLFLSYENGLGHSKWVPSFFHRRLKVKGTARNLNSLRKLLLVASK